MTCFRGIELRIIVFIFLLIPQCSSIFCSSQSRETNSIGTACTELEHCVSSFNPQTGDCPGNQCEPGWMGPGCQYVNLAYYPGVNSDTVFDGDMKTHRTIQDGRATIHFNGTFKINALRIRTITSNGHQGTLSVSDNQSRILYNDRFPSSSPNVFLTNSSLTNGLHMKFSPSLNIAEIEVFGGKNVALWKSTHQSTTYSYDGISFTPDKAVDGNGNGDWDIHTCTHTKPYGDHPTWSVDLGNMYYIIAIKIKNRNDNQDRLNGFKIYGTPEKGDLLLIYNDSSQTHNRSEIFLDSSHMVDVPIKMISIKGSNTGEKILTLCEVYIYASIKRKNGSFCPEKCQKNSNCRTDNLVCPTCQDGWERPYCYPIVCQQPISWNAPYISTSQKTYRYNETIRFVCSGGYYLSENQERKCTKNGPLEPPFPNCIAITCQQPISWNAPYISTNQKTYRYNETIRFLCSEGYYLSENQERKCTKNGPLEPPFPNCIAITCQQPVSWNTPNISTNQNTYKYNETIRFLCSEGFYLQGNQERKCTKNGLLEPPFPNCTAITCQQPVSWKSTNISTNRKTYRYNETIRFLCSEGFYLQGNQERKCTKSGPLEPPFPNCTAITCQPPVSSEAPHIMTDKETYNYNEIIQFSCSEGFFLQANQERNCTKNGPLKPPYPNCKVSQVTCQAPYFSDNLHISTDKRIYDYSETIRFSCSEGFFLQGTSERTCKRSGMLQPPFPKCTDITCPRPILSIRGSLQLSTNPLQQTFSYNESISFFCITGYILHGPTVKYCRQNGDFEQDLPFCTAQGKQESPSFTVGFFSGGAVGIVVNSFVIIFIFFLRRRLCQQKKKENAWSKGGNHEIDDNGHEYSGIVYQSSDREDHNPNVTELPVSVSDGHYTETDPISDYKDHQYTELNEIKMNQLREATAERPVKL